MFPRKAFHSGSDSSGQKTKLVLEPNVMKPRWDQLSFLSSPVTGSVSAPVLWTAYAVALLRGLRRNAPLTPGLERSHQPGELLLSLRPLPPSLLPEPPPKRIDSHLIYVTPASALRAGCETRPRPSARHRCPGNRAVVRVCGDARADGGGCWEMAAVTSVVEMCHHVMFPWAGQHPGFCPPKQKEEARGEFLFCFVWIVLICFLYLFNFFLF